MISERVVAKSAGSASAPEKATPASPIGVFDSGVGGLTVLAQMMKQLPHEDVIYLADTARVPYGGRSAEEIVKINQEIIPYLLKQGVKLIIMACGTSSAIAYPVLKDDYPVHMINLIEPGSREAVAASRSGRIGLIATAATVNSHAYQKKIKELAGDIEVHAVGCPLFVPLIEGGFIETEETRRVAKDYLKPLLKEKIDTLILGCTHYPHLSKVLQELAGPEVRLIDPAEAAVADAKAMLTKAGTLRTKAVPAKYKYFVTGSPIQFQDIGSRLLGKPIVGTKQVTLI
ncbi:MAG: glutamate racemase [Candidatus Saganbacteria bacterium]|nr:glutamate racemase [Candidatus Saganbacteria bacterium]